MAGFPERRLCAAIFRGEVNSPLRATSSGLAQKSVQQSLVCQLSPGLMHPFDARPKLRRGRAQRGMGILPMRSHGRAPVQNLGSPSRATLVPWPPLGAQAAAQSYSDPSEYPSPQAEVLVPAHRHHRES
jgi:hypothetical protein